MKFVFTEIKPGAKRTKLSAADQALIDEHIRNKGVTVCPPHKFSDHMWASTPWREFQHKQAADRDAKARDKGLSAIKKIKEPGA